MTNTIAGHGDDWKLKPGKPEGLIFKARVDMYFCGVMWTRQHFDKPYSIKLAWRTRDHETEKNNLGELSEQFQFNSGDCKEVPVPQLRDGWETQPQFIMDI